MYTRSESGGVDSGVEDMFDKMLVALNTVSEKPSHSQCQEHIVVSQRCRLPHRAADRSALSIDFIL